MKVFVTGATGFVGQEIVRQLREARHSIRILSRRAESSGTRELIAKFGVEAHVGDVTDARSLESSLQGIDAVIHLVGIISEAGESTFEKVHTSGTANMARAASAAGVSRFIHMSALGTRPAAVSRYHQSKWAAEEVVRSRGFNFTIFRPSLIYGPGDHFVNLFAKIIRYAPFVPVLGRRDAKFQPVAVEAVAAAFASSVAEPRSAGETFDLCGDETFTMDEMLDLIMKVLGERRIKVHLPGAVAKMQAALLEAVFALFRKAPPLNRDQLLMLQEDNVGNAVPARELFGLSLTPFEEGISRYIGTTK